MFFKKACGRTTITGACALLRCFSIVINESLVAHTFGTYTLELFDRGGLAGAGSRRRAAHVRVHDQCPGHRLVQTLSYFMAFLKIAGIAARDIAVHWGVLRYPRREISASAAILLTAIALDAAVLAALLIIKAEADTLVIYAAAAGMALIFAGKRLFLHANSSAGTGWTV